MALSTNPPMPFVGDGGRPASGDIRSDPEGLSFGGSIRDGGGDRILDEPVSELAVVLEYRLLVVLIRIELALDGEIERALSGGGLDAPSVSVVDSRANMPGILSLANPAPAAVSVESSSDRR
jgi:hypothetical protein